MAYRLLGGEEGILCGCKVSRKIKNSCPVEAGCRMEAALGSFSFCCYRSLSPLAELRQTVRAIGGGALSFSHFFGAVPKKWETESVFLLRNFFLYNKKDLCRSPLCLCPLRHQGVSEETRSGRRVCRGEDEEILDSTALLWVLIYLRTRTEVPGPVCHSDLATKGKHWEVRGLRRNRFLLFFPATLQSREDDTHSSEDGR